MEASQIPVVVYGRGALCEELAGLYDARVWMDVTPRTAVLNFKYGRYKNLGANEALSYALGMRRNYYVDFEIAVDLRWKLIKENRLDYYISADVPEQMWMLPYAALKTLFRVVYGDSIAAHVRAHRMEAAASRLIKTQDEIAAIAQASAMASVFAQLTPSVTVPISGTFR